MSELRQRSSPHTTLPPRRPAQVPAQVWPRANPKGGEKRVGRLTAPDRGRESPRRGKRGRRKAIKSNKKTWEGRGGSPARVEKARGAQSMLSDWAEGAPRGHPRGSGRDLRIPPDRLGKLPAQPPRAKANKSAPGVGAGARHEPAAPKPPDGSAPRSPAAPPPAPARRRGAARRFRGTRGREPGKRRALPSGCPSRRTSSAQGRGRRTPSWGPSARETGPPPHPDPGPRSPLRK